MFKELSDIVSEHRASYYKSKVAYSKNTLTIIKMLQHKLTIAEAEITPAELRVLQYLVQGLSNLDIAVSAGVCKRTVQAQVSSMLSKTELSNRTALALWAVQQPEITNQTSN